MIDDREVIEMAIRGHEWQLDELNEMLVRIDKAKTQKSKTRTRRKLSPEARKKISLAQKARWAQTRATQKAQTGQK